MNYNNELISAAMEQLALDMSCRADDFLKNENTLVYSKKNFGRRMFVGKKDFFHLTTFGYGAVASVNKKIYKFTDMLLNSAEGIHLFDADSIFAINTELLKYKLRLGSLKEYYLPLTPYKKPCDNGFSLKIYDENNISELLEHRKFQNALCFNTEGLRRDVLAITATDGDEIIAMAGASSDSEKFWQIGIDVMPEYRHNNIASTLVSNLTYEVFKKGVIPYYGTWWSNIASRNVARKSGYFPAWCEMSSIPL